MSWYGKEVNFGLHYDLHAKKEDTELGLRADPETLARQLGDLGADFVQTDCKGHGGYLSWKSKLPASSLPPKLKHDALKAWREATRKLGVPLHCHYSGIWDKAASERFPEWASVDAAGKTSEKMCPRGPYLEELLIPQFRELLTRYGVDGFWVDGDLWGVEMCYCPRCMAAWKLETGLEAAPVSVEDPEWGRWWRFQRQGFLDYVTRYCDAAHAANPQAKVASNWLYTFKSPGEPTVPVDWLSGDNTPNWGLDGSRCEARFLSTRGKPWDIMLWSFLSNGWQRPDSPWAFKPAQMLMQEAAVLASFGGNVQIYETTPLRDGRLIDWRLAELHKVKRFLRPRFKLASGNAAHPQIALLHSEADIYSKVKGDNLFHPVPVAASAGLLFALLESGFGVDILDEWALLRRLEEFPAVAVPEADRMSDAMVAALTAYVRDGGVLLAVGTGMAERFGADFFGAEVAGHEEGVVHTLPGKTGTTPMYGDWDLVKAAGARELASLSDPSGVNPTGYAAALVNRCGKGRAGWIPCNAATCYHTNRYVGTRDFIGSVMRRVAGVRLISAEAPAAVDIAYRRKEGKLQIHLINRSSGVPNLPNQGMVDEIFPVGPIRLTVPGSRARVLLEKGALSVRPDGRGNVVLELDRVRIHAVIEVR